MSRVVWILAVLLSHWRRHPMQLATLLIGLISATALWSGVQALNQQARMQLRPRRGGVRRRANADAGRPRRHDLPAATLCRTAPRRLAGIAGARRPPSDRRTVVPAVGHRTGHAAGRGRQRAGDRKGRSASLHHAAGRNAGGARNACPNSACRKAPRPLASSGASLPPLHVQPQLVPGVLVVDIGIAQQLLNMPDRISRLLIGKAKGQRAPLENDRRRQAPPGRSRTRRAISNASPTAFTST